MYSKVVILFILVGIGFAAEVMLSDKYDYIDVDTILKNPRQRDSYYKCFAETGPCATADSKFFRDHFPEAIVSNCRKCTKKQVENFDKFADWLSTNDEKTYNAIVAMALKKYKKN